MASSRALEDGPLILMAWEVVERRGWAFVINTLLRGGIELFPADPSSSEEKGFWEGVGRDTQLSLFSPPLATTDFSTVMASQESEDEEEEAPLWDMFKLSSSGSGGQKSELNTSLVTPSSLQEQSPVQRDHQLNLSVDSKIKEFIAEATLSFSKYFSKTDISAMAQDLLFTQSEESRNDPLVQVSSVILADSLPEVLPIKAPSEELPVAVSTPSQAVPLQAKPPVQQVAKVPAMPASQTVAVTKPVRQLSPNMTLLPPLAAHICKDLQVTVISLKYFNMFGLLQGQSHEIFLSQTVLAKGKNFTISEWQKSFAIMGSILLEHAPEKMKGFFNYGETICSVHEKGTSKGWLNYDEEFRRLKERQPDLGWDTIHSGLWQQVCSQPVAVVSSMKVPPTKALNASSVKPVEVPPRKEKNASSVKPVAGDRGSCWMYNNQQCKMGNHCHYFHVCSSCSGRHPKMHCPKLNPVSSGPPLKRTK